MPDPWSSTPHEFAGVRRLVAALSATEDTNGSHPPIPGYTIIERLGGGGGGEVYRATREGNDRPLAIKILTQRMGKGRSAARAWRELDVLSQLHLPNVPRVQDYGWFEGRLFIVTDLVEGRPLLQHCAAGPGLTLRERVDLLARVCGVVQSLHEHGVIHRDLKPSNILVDIHGEPVVIDLGLAMLADSDAAQSLTTDGAPLGTPAYMSPEQARGERAAISTRSDVYSLGATAYHVLTGQTPHELSIPFTSTEGSPAAARAATGGPGGAVPSTIGLHEAIRRVAQDPARDPRAIDPTLPMALAAVLAKACAANAEARYGSAAELGEDMGRWMRGDPVEASGVGVWFRIVRWVGRHPVLTTAAASALAGITILGSSIAMTWEYARRAMWMPSRFEVERGAQPRGARLMSGAGIVLDTIGYGPDQEVLLAQLVQQPLRRGGGTVAVVAIGGPAGNKTGTGQQVWVCDPRQLHEPMHSTQPGVPFLVPPALPPVYRDQGPSNIGDFGVNCALVADVFDQNEGAEIIVNHLSSAESHDCIRVYDMELNPLFEVWHYGHFRDLYWWEEHGLLLATGERHGKENRSWQRLGLGDLPLDAYPRVVVAVKPQWHALSGWISEGDASEPAGVVRWYKAFWPPDSSLSLSAPSFFRTTDRAVVGLTVAERARDGATGRLLVLGEFSQMLLPDGSFSTDGPIPVDSLTNYYGSDKAAREAASQYSLIDFPPPEGWTLPR